MNTKFVQQISKVAAALAFIITAYSAIAQTPFDSYAPSKKKREMLKLPNATFKAYNSDTTSNISYVELDKETNELSYYDKEKKIVQKRVLKPNEVKWLSIDPLASKYPGMSPYNFVGNSPIRSLDPDGKDIYILFYTSGNGRGDEMFRASALTRQRDIEKGKGFDPSRDKVVVLAVQDMATIKNKVNDVVKQFSPQYGQTAEFGIWSHAGTSGPTGSIKTTQDNLASKTSNALDRNQMTLEGWGKIDFNWKNNGAGATAGFYGCNTGANTTAVRDIGSAYGVENYDAPSFANSASALPNFKNVTVSGQMSSAFPSQYTNYRLNSEKTKDQFINSENNSEVIFQRTYMVGGEHSLFGLNSASSQTVAKPMQTNVNGTTIGTSIQPGTTKL